jgi:LuxR family maltose regulon positive regulatory protein
VEPLSTKEKEVLNWLDSELTGPQIASRLFVSLNTLRTHTKNIYSKLDVNNRRAAINKAKSLGYLNENTLNSIE